MTEFILLCGLNNSGKSTYAKRISKLLIKKGKTVEIKSFATPLKELAKTYFNYDEVQKNEQRDILEQLAFKMKEIFGQSLFAYTLLDSCDKVHADYIIIDDLRYKEEFDVVSEFYPTTVIRTPWKIADTDILGMDNVRLTALLIHMDNTDYIYYKLKDYTDKELQRVIISSE